MLGIQDLNIVGSGHGGRLLDFMTREAGFVAVKRHLAQNHLAYLSPRLVCVGNTTFLSKVLPESLIEAHAQIVWSSSRTMVAKIDLFTEVLETGERTLATTTNASYVAVGEEEGAGSIGKTSEKLPDFGHENEQLAGEGELFYRSRKAFIKNASEGLLPRLDKIVWTLELAHVVQRTDCWYETDMAKGGMLIDLMDEAAGKVAFTYTGRVCATVSIDNLSIVKPLYLGDLASIKARPAFVSGKMMEIEVVAFGSQSFSNESQLAAYGHFVFVCLGDDGRAVTLPKLMDTADVAAQERARMRQQRREATKLVSSM